MAKLVVEKSIEITAPAAKVWAVLTKPEFTSQWAEAFGATGPIDSDWQPDSQVLWRNAKGEVYVHGKVVAMEPEKLLQFTTRDVRRELQPVSGLEEDDITQRYALSGQAGHTTLSIANGDFGKLANGEEIFPFAIANWDGLLPKLKELAEK